MDVFFTNSVPATDPNCRKLPGLHEPVHGHVRDSQMPGYLSNREEGPYEGPSLARGIGARAHLAAKYSKQAGAQTWPTAFVGLCTSDTHSAES
jgi:hypothetical protein